MTWRTPEERFGLYVVRSDLRCYDRRSQPKLLATGPDLDSIGCAFGRLLAEGNIREDDWVGVHRAAEAEGVTGDWVLNPYEGGG